MTLSTLLSIGNQAEAELGLTQSSGFAGQTSGQPAQMFALLNSCGRKLLREHNWGDLQTQGTIVTVAGTSTYALPSDYSKMIAETQWDTSTKWPMNGPVTPQMIRALTEGPYAWPSNRIVFQQIGFRFLKIYPTPAASSITYDFAYVSKKWALSAGAVAQTEFALDTDTSFFDPDLLVADLKWRFMAMKGLGAAAALKIERDELLDLVKAGDIGGKTLDMGEPRGGLSWGAIGSSTPGNILFSIGEDF